jgi:multiple sugar transport system permease protein
MAQWYLRTLMDYLIAGSGIALVMVLVYQVLSRLGAKRETAAGYALIMPWLLGLIIWTAYPIGASLYYSFTNFNGLQTPAWVGISNYQRLLESNSYFWPSLRMTMLYGALSLPIGLALSLAVAMLLARDVRGIGFWRTMYYIPAVIPAVATIILWIWLLSTDGLFNQIMSPIYRLIGMQRPSWFTDPNYALPGLIIMSLWGVFGANTVILLAGLKNIPNHLYEAVDIDGGGGWAKFRHVTLPMVSPTLFYTLVLGVIAAIKTFEPGIFIRLPRSTGTFLQVLVYQYAFGTRALMGLASALSWVMLIIIALLTLLVFRTSALWVFYEGERRK